MRWLTNGHIRDKRLYIKDFVAGHGGLRQIAIGHPKPTQAYTAEQLEGMDLIGFYEVGSCGCEFCREQREERYYKPLLEWRKMNAQTIKRRTE